jgi:adenylylsulfate kinase
MNRRGTVVWMTGLSGAGKSTIAGALVAELRRRGVDWLETLDGDEVREHLSAGLGFSKEDRDTNIRRIAWVAHKLARNGVIVLVAAISPYRDAREAARRLIGADFLEVFVDAPLAEAERRDPKGLYRKARAGAIQRFTGVSDPYEPPDAPEVHCHTADETVEESAAKIVTALDERGYLPPSFFTPSSEEEQRILARLEALGYLELQR